MSRIFTRQVIGVILVALLVATAGCSGLTGSDSADTGDGEADKEDEEDEEDEEQTDDEETDEQAEGEATATDDGGGAMDGSSTYQWTSGESYEYDLESSGGFTQELSWEVTSVSGSDVTVEVTVDTDGEVSTSTLEGSQDEIFQEAEAASNGGFFASMHAANRIGEGRSLSVGNSWTVDQSDSALADSDDEWETADVEVTGTDSYAGIECTVVEFTPNGGDLQPLTVCINQDRPFVLSFSSTTEQGTELTIELTAANS